MKKYLIIISKNFPISRGQVYRIETENYTRYVCKTHKSKHFWINKTDCISVEMEE